MTMSYLIQLYITWQKKEVKSKNTAYVTWYLCQNEHWSKWMKTPKSQFISMWFQGVIAYLIQLYITWQKKKVKSKNTAYVTWYLCQNEHWSKWMKTPKSQFISSNSYLLIQLYITWQKKEVKSKNTAYVTWYLCQNEHWSKWMKTPKSQFISMWFQGVIAYLIQKQPWCPKHCTCKLTSRTKYKHQSKWMEKN